MARLTKEEHRERLLALGDRHKTPKQEPVKPVAFEAGFEEALDVVVAELIDGANKMAEASSRQPSACLMTLLRPHVALRVDPTKHRVDIDNRRRNWIITIEILDLSYADGIPELYCEFEEEVVKGLDEVSVAIRECIEMAHEKDDFNILCVPELTDTNMKKRMAGLHPAISRGGGEAGTRIHYALQDGKAFVCKAHIKRA